jgi:TetR/AcrR family transcriptional regulator, transcriptional repressor for nem operon
MARPSSKGKLLQAGLDVLHERGFNGCSIQDITEAAQVPKGSFFNHFKTKEDLALQVLGPYGESSRLDMLFEEGVPALERLRNHFQYLAEGYERHGYTRGCLLGNLANEMATAYPDMREALDNIYRFWSTSVAKVLRDAQVERSIDSRLDPEEMAAFLVNAWAGVVLRAKVMKSREPVDGFFDVTFKLLLK